MGLLNTVLNTELRLSLMQTKINSEIIEQANHCIQPAEKLSEENAHFRILYLVSDRVNAYRGRFPADELQNLVELLPNSPVMVGHRRDKLPIARCFHADIVTDADGIKWVRAFIYWMKNTAGADTLRLNIDSGIYRECSLCFSYTTPECSRCGRDIRGCPHNPMTGGNGDGSALFYYYRGIKSVMEISLVYKGANHGTRITGLSDDNRYHGIHIIADSRYGQFDICVNTGEIRKPELGRAYYCQVFEKHASNNRKLFCTIHCSSYVDIADGIPNMLFVEDSPLRGMYRFSRIKRNGKYQLTILREV